MYDYFHQTFGRAGRYARRSLFGNVATTRVARSAAHASLLGLAGTAYKRNTNHSPNTPHVMRTCRGCDAGADGARSERWARKSALWAVDRSDSCRVFAHAEYSYDTGATRYSAARDHAAVLRSSSTSVACCRERSAGGLGIKCPESVILSTGAGVGQEREHLVQVRPRVYPTGMLVHAQQGRVPLF